MRLTLDSGHALVVSGSRVWPARFSRDFLDTFHFTDESGKSTEVREYDDKTDFYYWNSDDGDVLYTAVHVVAEAASPEDLPEPPTLAIPTEEDLQASAATATKGMADAHAAGHIYASDLSFARNIVTRPATIWNAYRGHGDVARAQKETLDAVFGAVAAFSIPENEVDPTPSKAELIRWLTETAEGRSAFEVNCGAPGRTPASYLDEYSDRPGIVDALAGDTGYYERSEDATP